MSANVQGITPYDHAKRTVEAAMREDVREVLIRLDEMQADYKREMRAAGHPYAFCGAFTTASVCLQQHFGELHKPRVET